jgi:hypothetical protein
MLALSRSTEGSKDSDPLRFRFGFIASSDNHTARAGTGYKEVERRHFTDARMAEVGRSPLATRHRRPAAARSERFDESLRIPSVGFLETERSGSFYLSGGLAAVHAESRNREDIWDALERRETYGTSGPRILLWFDLLDPEAPGGVRPMGSEVVLTPDHLEALCLGECDHPSNRRRPISRIEVVRIRPQQEVGEGVSTLIEDPWRVLPCKGDERGCDVVFSDPEFASAARDTTYYVRAIEVPSPVVNADPLGCTRDENGICVSVEPCFDRPDSDDCLSDSEQRAWSSPIFVDYGSRES